MRIIAVIPGYNEATHIGPVIERTRALVDLVLVVDDGSKDATGDVARHAGARVVRHVMNRGLGAALGTGFAAAKELGADVVITLDADGQHDPDEIPKFLKAIADGADVVIGSRMLTHYKGMPWYRMVANMLGNVATFVLFGAWVTDSQSGYRALSRHALEHIQVRSNRMEVSSEIVSEAKRNQLKIAEVPIKAIYTDYSLSKGQGFVVGVKMLAKLVIHRLFG